MSDGQDKAAVHPQFYKKVVALSDKEHADWRIKRENQYEFSRGTNAVLITAVEFSLVVHEYPIVFVEQADNINPVAILGLKPQQNLFLDEKYAWDAQYIPAYVRRYPFILAGDDNKPDTTYTVCIDENFTGFNRKSGERLFTEEGKYTPYLERAISFLKDFQSQGNATQQFCRNLKKMGLLEPMQANIASAQDGDFSVAGFMVVSRARLKELKPLDMQKLVKSDEMALIYQHLLSLGNFNKLIERYTSSQMAEAS